MSKLRDVLALADQFMEGIFSVTGYPGDMCTHGMEMASGDCSACALMKLSGQDPEQAPKMMEALFHIAQEARTVRDAAESYRLLAEDERDLRAAAEGELAKALASTEASAQCLAASIVAEARQETAVARADVRTLKGTVAELSGRLLEHERRDQSSIVARLTHERDLWKKRAQMAEQGGA